MNVDEWSLSVHPLRRAGASSGQSVTRESRGRQLDPVTRRYWTTFEKMRNPKLLSAAAGWRSTTSLPPHLVSLSQNTTNITLTGEEDKMAYWPGLAWDLAFASMILVSIVGNSTVLLIIISESLHVTFLTFCKLLLLV